MLTISTARWILYAILYNAPRDVPDIVPSNLVHDFLVPHESIPKMAPHRFSHFCWSLGCDQHTDRNSEDKHTQTIEHR